MFDLFTVLDACAKANTDFSVKAKINEVETEIISSDSFYKYCEYNFWDRNVISRHELVDDVVSDFVNQWGVYLAFEQDNIDKMFSVYMSQYNPLNNAERTEETTNQSSGLDSTTITTIYGKSTTNSGSDNDTSTNSASGYDNANNLVPTDKNVSDTTYGKTVTDSGTDRNTTGVTYGKKDVTTFHTSGTIGVITNQDMIEKELKLRENVLRRKIIDKFIRETTVYC